MPNEGRKREKSSLFIFVPIMLLATYLVYVVIAYAYNYGIEKGLSEAPYRQPVEEDGEDEQVFNYRQLMKPSEDLVSLGARVYSANCQACHGATGEGDGPSGRNLSVRPRAFDSDPAEWQIGASTLQMYETLENGLGQMPNFPALNPEQKFAVIHYIHNEFMDGEHPESPPEMVAALPEPSAGGGGVNINPYAEERVPVDFAIMKLTREGDAPESSAPKNRQ